MDVHSLYMAGDTLADLAADGRVSSYLLASEGGRARLGLFLKTGCMPGLMTGEQGPPVDIIFAWGYVAFRLTLADGTCVLTRPAARLEPEEIEELLTEPLALVSLAVASGGSWNRAETAPAIPRPDLHVTGDTIAMLQRHAAVSDLVFGSDGRECTLQFQLLRSFAGVDSRPGFDWVGIEFDEERADIGWFDDRQGFEMSSYCLPEDADALAALLADPLGHVLAATRRAEGDDGADGIAGLMERLKDSFALPR